MKALFKKPIAVILAALLLLTVFPLTATAATTAEQSTGATSGTTGSCTWTLDDEGTLTISGNGEMADYDWNSSPWDTNIKSVSIENGVTSIGHDAFYGCTGLTSVTIPDSVTSIGGDAFYRCTGLKGVYITDIAAWCNIKFSSNPLSYAHKLYLNNQLVKDLEIPDSVTSIGYSAFNCCTGLTSVTIPDSVTSIGGGAFNCCTGLTSVTIPDSVTSIGYSAFYGCTGLTSVTIPDSVTSIGSSAFNCCTGLTSVTIPDSVTSIGGSAFYNTAWYNNQPNGLIYAGKFAYEYKGTMPANTTVVIKDGTKGIADSAFKYCTGLTSVTIGNSVTSIGDYAFYECTKLTSVTIGNSVTSIGNYAFYKCTGLTSLTIPNSVTSIGDDAFEDCTGLTSVTIGNSVTSIGSEAFRGCTGLTSVTIGNSVTNIESSAFSGCTGLTSITIPDSVTSIGSSSFSGCTGLKGVYITDLAAWCNIKFDSDSSNPLYYAHNLYLNNQLVTDLVIPDSVTSVGDDAFMGCTGLTSVTIPNSVTSIGWGAFRGCTGLTTVTIGNSVTSIGNSAFEGCTELKDVYITDLAAWCNINFNNAYSNPLYYAHNLYLNNQLVTDLVIPDGVTSIGDYAFSDCTELTSVTIPDSVISIGSSAFRGCTGFTCLTIPDSVTDIGELAFNGCTNLASISISDLVPKLGQYAFTSTAWFNKQPSGIVYLGKYAYYFKGTIPKNIVIKEGTIGIADYAFYSRNSFASLTIPDSVTYIGDLAFSGCTGLTSVTIPDSVKSIGDEAFFNCTGLTSVTISDSVKSIGDLAFNGCNELKKVTIPNSVTSIGEKAFGYYNNGYNKLSGFTIYGENGSEAENYANNNKIKFVNINDYPITGTTGDCTWTLTLDGTLTISGNGAIADYTQNSDAPWGTDITSVVIGNGVSSIGKCAFSGCKNLASVTIPGSVTSIGESAFNGCTGLTGVYISDLAAWCSMKFTDNSFNPLYYAHKLYLNNQLVTNLVIPDGVKSIGTYTFSGCTSLKSLNVSGSVKNIGGYAFKGCTGLTDINFSNGLVSIGGFSFEGTKLKTLIFPQSLNYIGYSAFSGCTGLTSVTIPNSAASIGDKAFYNCYNLTIYGLTGSTAESYADNFGINFVSLDDMPTEPTTEEPTTAEPTTEEPTTAEPTTEEPTTAEPTTEQPDDPQGTDVTIKLAAPVSTFASRYTWNDAVFYYGNTSNFDDLTKVSMTDTGEKFYTTDTFNSTIITPGAWKIYSVTLTAEQIQAVDASKFAGFATSDNVNRTKLAKNANVFSAATGEYANYSSAASGAGGFDGKTFVFANASYGSTSPISYMGYWINSYVTVKAAAPMANTSYSRWDSMQLYYGNTAALADMETVDLFNTKETTKVTNSGDMTIKNGRWYIYAITLTDTQANAVDSAAYVGFKKAGAENRTSIMMNVLKAKTNSFDGTYGAKRTLNDLEGQVFVISGQTKTGISVATYVGQWKTRDVYTAGDNDEITIYFAVPKAVKAVDSWDTGVEFYYSNENSYKDAARMQMTPEPDYDIYSDFSGETFEQGSCSVYSLTIPAVKVREIDECKKVGFVKKGSYNRTYYAQGYAVTRASTVGDNQSYGLPQSIEAFDGNIFVITGCTDPNNERVTYTGWWN